MDRERYHIVEQFEKPIINNGRQALFEISAKTNIENVRRLHFKV